MHTLVKTSRYNNYIYVYVHTYISQFVWNIFSARPVKDRADQDQLILAASKSVIAHLEGAAGVAGITKLVKMLEHKRLASNKNRQQILFLDGKNNPQKRAQQSPPQREVSKRIQGSWDFQNVKVCFWDI